MLKIKDNVDLKELEKFGYEVIDFNYVINAPYNMPLCRKLLKQINKKRNIRKLAIIIKERVVKLIEFDECWWVERQRIRKKYIQDIIQAGLVEKVVE